MKMNGKMLVLQSQIGVIQDQILMERAQNLALDILQKIIEQIQQGNLEINKNKLDLQMGIKQGNFYHKSMSVPHLNFPVPSHSNQDEEKIKQMIRKQKQYQQKLENKARLLEQTIKQEQNKHKQILQQEKKKIFQNKKSQVLLSIQQMKQRRQNRYKSNRQQNINLLAIKTRKNLFQTYKQKWQKIQIQQKKQKQKNAHTLLEKRKINFDQIKQHAKKHDQTMTKFRQSRIAQSRISQPEVKKFYESVFMGRIIEEDQQFKEDFGFKKKRAKQLAEIKAQYGKNIRQNYKPEAKQPFVPTVNLTRASKSLSYIQTVRKGNDYLKQGNTKISQRSIAQSKLGYSQKDKKQFFQYKNYLTEIRIKKDELQKQMNLNQRIQKQKKYQKQIKKIMNNPELTEQQKFIKAKLVAKRMQSQIYKKNPLKLIDSINAKIQILKHVSA